MFGVDKDDIPDVWTGDNSASLSAVVSINGVPNKEPELPTHIGLMTNLRWLVSVFDALGGTIPSEIGKTPIEFLTINENQRIRGTLPTELGLVTTLTNLGTHHNNLTGTIPTEFAQLTKLTTLQVSSNQLTGTISNEFSVLTNLREFQVGDNSLTGSFPSELCSLTGLTALNIDDNLLNSTLPSEIGFLTKLETLAAARNLFSGSLPTQIGLLTNLGDLEADFCEFSGAVPSQLGMLHRLSALKLSDNHLTGMIPSQLGHVTTLSRLSLSNNDLTGTIPSQLALLTNLEIFFVTNLDGLRGILPLGWLSRIDSQELKISCLSSGLQLEVCGFQPPEFVDSTVLIIVFLIVALVAVLIVSAACLVVLRRSHPMIKGTNPPFSLIILIGLLWLDLAVVPFGVAFGDVNDDLRTIACQTGPHMFVDGLVIVLAAISVRNYPLWKIFTNPTLRPVSLSFKRLLGPIVACLLITTTLTTPMSLYLEAKELKFGCHTPGFDSFLYLLAGLFAFIACLSVAACYMSFKIRRVPSLFNETNLITRGISGLLTFGVGMLVVAFFATNSLVQFLCVSLCVTLATTHFVVALYQDKFRHIVLGQQGSKPEGSFRTTSKRQTRDVSRNAFLKPSPSKNSEQLSNRSETKEDMLGQPKKETVLKRPSSVRLDDPNDAIEEGAATEPILFFGRDSLRDRPVSAISLD